MSKPSVTLTYIRRQARRLNSSITSFIGGRRDFSNVSSAVLVPYDGGPSRPPKEYEASLQDDHDTDSNQNASSSSNADDSVEAGRPEPNVVGMLSAKSSENHTNTNPSERSMTLSVRATPSIVACCSSSINIIDSGFPSVLASSTTHITPTPASNTIEFDTVDAGVPEPTEYLVVKEATSDPVRISAALENYRQELVIKYNADINSVVEKGPYCSTSTPSVVPAASSTETPRIVPDQPSSPTTPSLDPFTTASPSARVQVRSLCEVARLPAFYGLDELVRTNWKNDHGAYEGQTSLPTWDPIRKQWQISQNAREPATVSAMPLVVANTSAVPVPESSHKTFIPVPTETSTIEVEENPAFPGGSGLLKTKRRDEITRVRRTATNVKEALLCTPKENRKPSPSLRRSARIAHLTSSRTPVTVAQGPIPSPTLSPATPSPSSFPKPRKRSRKTDEEEGGDNSGSVLSMRKKAKRSSSRVETPTRKSPRKRK